MMLTPDEILSGTDENAAALAMMVWCMDQNARMTGGALEMVIEGLEIDVTRLKAENAELRERLDTITDRVLWLVSP